MDKTGDSLFYSPEMVCKLIVSTMILHNFCIDRGMLTDIDIFETEFPNDFDEDQPSPTANLLREQIVDYYSS